MVVGVVKMSFPKVLRMITDITMTLKTSKLVSSVLSPIRFWVKMKPSRNYFVSTLVVPKYSIIVSLETIPSVSTFSSFYWLRSTFHLGSSLSLYTSIVFYLVVRLIESVTVYPYDLIILPQNERKVKIF